MSESLQLGKLITTPQSRDAIHIAVVPVTVDKMCRPGQRVGLIHGSVVSPLYEDEAIGVIDPFLTVPVLSGQRCWLYLNPGSITSLRHDWTHPAFDKDQA